MKLFIKLLLIICCLIFIYFSLQDNQLLIESILNFDTQGIIVIVFFSVLAIFLYSKIILLLIRFFSNISISNTKWSFIYFNSQFLNSIPFLGILYRANQLKKLGVEYKKFFIIYVIINWIYLFITLIIISIELFIFIPNFKVFNFNLYKLFFFSGLILIILPMLISNIFLFKNKKFANQNYIVKLRSFISFFDIRKYSFKFVISFILLFFFLHLTELIIFLKLASLLKIEISFYNSYLAFIGSTLIDALNVLPQNILISDIGYGIVTEKLEEDFELGVVIKLYLRFIIFISSLLVAILYNVYIYSFNIKIHE